MTRTATPVSRTHVLTDTLELAGQAVEKLKLIDLRTVKGPLRETVKKAREDASGLESGLRAAIRQDGESLRQAG